MEYRVLGTSELKVSALALGTMTFGEQNTEIQVHQQLDIAAAAGINFIDTAEMYPVPPRAQTAGQSEVLIGKWLRQRGGRERFVISSKAAGPGVHLPHIRSGHSTHTAAHLTAALDGSLRRLQTDYIDLYQLHWPDRATNMFGQLGYKPAQRAEQPRIEESLRALSEFVAAGKVRYLGLSNETPWGMLAFLRSAAAFDLPRMVSIQNPYNLLNRSFEIGLAEIAHRERVSLLAYSPLGFGVLSGKYARAEDSAAARLNRYKRFVRYTNAQGNAATEAYLAVAKEFDIDPSHMAISFILNRPYVASAIIGATDEKQLRHNIDSLRYPASKELLKALDKIHTRFPNPCP